MTDPGPHDIEIIAKRSAFQGYFRIDEYTVRHGRFDGGWHKPITREFFERGHASAVLPYDPLEGVFVLCEQFRIGAYAAHMTPFQIELVAGIIEPGETPEAVARREVQEEAGLEILDLLPVAHYLASPGGATETTALYLGRVVAPESGGIFGLDGEGEHIRVHILPEANLRRMLDEGRLENAQTIIAAQWFFLNRDKVIKTWT